MLGSKAPDYDTYGLLRTTCSPQSYPTFAYRGAYAPLLCSYWGGSQRSFYHHCIAVQDPLYLSPLTTCNRNVETLVQRHSCLRSLTSWAKCLRNTPCQCTAHATTSVDIGLFKSESFPHAGTFSLNKYEISNKK